MKMENTNTTLTLYALVRDERLKPVKVSRLKKILDQVSIVGKISGTVSNNEQVPSILNRHKVDKSRHTQTVRKRVEEKPCSVLVSLYCPHIVNSGPSVDDVMPHSDSLGWQCKSSAGTELCLQ